MGHNDALLVIRNGIHYEEIRLNEQYIFYRSAERSAIFGYYKSAAIEWPKINHPQGP